MFLNWMGAARHGRHHSLTLIGEPFLSLRHPQEAQKSELYLIVCIISLAEFLRLFRLLIRLFWNPKWRFDLHFLS